MRKIILLCFCFVSIFSTVSAQEWKVNIGDQVPYFSVENKEE